MVMRHAVTAEYLAKFPKLACVVRMGAGYDKINGHDVPARTSFKTESRLAEVWRDLQVVGQAATLAPEWERRLERGDSQRFCRRLLREIGTAATPGTDFDIARSDATVRFSFAGATATIASLDMAQRRALFLHRHAGAAAPHAATR